MTRFLLIGWLSAASIACGGRTDPALVSVEVVTDARGSKTPEDAPCSTEGGVTTLFSGPGLPSAIAVHNGLVYFADWTFGGSLSVVARDGSGLRVLATDQPAVQAIAADGEGVVWTTVGLTTPGGALLTIDRTGRSKTLLSNLNQPDGVALNREKACVAEGSNFGGGAPQGIGRVVCVDRNGEHVEMLAKSELITSVALDEAYVYFNDLWLGLLARVSVRGGETQILSRDFKASALSVVGEELFFGTGSQVYVMPKAGGLPRQLATLPRLLSSLATDGDAIFLGVPNPSRIEEGALFGVELREPFALMELATNQASVRGVALDATRVYWAGGDHEAAYVRSKCRATAP
jgi:hypothetical protein